MVTVNKTMNEDIKEFPVFELVGNKLLPAPHIISTKNYDHKYFDLHHYIKARNFRDNREWYEKNGIKMKLIKMKKIIHQHLEYPLYALSDEDFFRVYHIPKDDLLFNKKKWITKQVLTKEEE